MKPSSQQEQRYRLTASDVAAYFKHRCDRNFRWNTVEAELFRVIDIQRGHPDVSLALTRQISSHQ